MLFIYLMIIQPKTVYEGATVGLQAWWNIVFPSLLPFFIASELLMSLGIVSFMGVLLEPIMRPLFNVPGCGSFVMVVGFSSGCPIGSMITAKLRRNNMCTRVEAERLMSFTNNSSPLFMLVAVSVGMFGNPKLGGLIVGAHYLANLTLGLMLRFYRPKDGERIASQSSPHNVIKRSFAELSRYHRNEKRPIGQIIGDAVTNSINTLLKIGGFMILFAVIIRLLTEMGFIDLLAQLFSAALFFLGFEQDVYKSIASGIFEITLGTKLASETNAPLLQQLLATAMMLGWSGLSIHAQVASLIADTDIRIYPYIFTRLAHSTLGALYTYLFWTWSNPMEKGWLDVPTLSSADNVVISAWAVTGQCFKIFLIILLLFILLGFLNQLFNSAIKLVKGN
ncbi:sporulation integral membrane protein YlbJ [Peptococcaceae bacterium 1198_IL3148]